MAETGEETYYIVGESRTNVDNAITKVYGSFFIAFEVIPSKSSSPQMPGECRHDLY